MDIEADRSSVHDKVEHNRNKKDGHNRKRSCILVIVGIIAIIIIGVFINRDAHSSSVLAFLFSRTKCYNEDGIGCFTTASPYNNFKGFLPESPTHIQIGFWLYTRANRNTPQHVTKDTTSIHNSRFNGTKHTKFIIHGYNDDGGSQWVKDMAHAFLAQEDVNVFVVNWEKGADNLNYIQSASNTQVVGALVAQFVTQLHSSAHAQYKDIHLIGHSLGSHISGFVGSRIRGLGRITGLDPAGPLFEKADPKARLDPTDAIFVDAIHTDGDSLLELGFGIGLPVGDVDFFPNGGTDQPGCVNEVGRHLFSLITGKITGFTTRIACSHMRVLDLFTESISSHCTFRAHPCASQNDFKAGKCNTCGAAGCSIMGYHSNRGHPHGTFYLSTHASSPYCM